MPFCSRFRLGWLLFVGCSATLLSGALAGCASSSPASNKGPYDVEAFATRPHLDINWRRALDPPEMWAYKPRQYATPLYRAATDELFVGTDSGRLFKVRAGDGKVLWQTKLNGPIHARPTFGDARVYVGTLNGRFYALDEASGKVVWSTKLDGSVESRAAFAQGRVFYTTSNDLLVAADAATGKQLWTFKRSTPEYFTIKETGKPVVRKGVVYCGFSDGVLAALQLDTGELVWKSDLSGSKTEFTDVDDVPIVAGSRIYAASYDGGMYAIDRNSGEKIWHRDITGITDYIYGEDSLYVATANGHVVSLGADEGKPGWSFRFKNHSPVSMAATRLYLFVSTAGGPMYVLDRLTGRPLMNWNPSDGFDTRIVLGKTSGYALSNGGYLYGFDVAF